jgi:hypothetical protein
MSNYTASLHPPTFTGCSEDFLFPGASSAAPSFPSQFVFLWDFIVLSLYFRLISKLALLSLQMIEND